MPKVPSMSSKKLIRLLEKGGASFVRRIIMNKYSCLFAISFLVFFFFGASYSYSMNDTDGVSDRGIFPLNDAGKFLEISSVEVEVNLTIEGIIERRAYKIKNKSDSNTFNLGTILCYNCLSKSEGNDVKIYINDHIIKIVEKIGFLRDSGDKVEVFDISRQKCADSINNNDGTIDCHYWGSFEVKFDSNETKNIKVEYSDTYAPIDLSHQVANRLSLYTEKFWSGNKVPIIKFYLKSNKNMIPVEYFMPDRREGSKLPDIINDAELIWSLKNYAPTKKKYVYTYWLIQPSAIADKQLQGIRTPESVETIINILNNKSIPEKPVREYAISILGRAKDPRGVIPLIEVLERKGAIYGRNVLLNALVNIGKPAVKPLINLLNHESWIVRFNAAGILGQIKDPTAVDPLIVLLQNNNEDVTGRAIWALGMIKDKRALDSIKNVIKNNEFNRRNILNAISILAYYFEDYGSIELFIELLKEEDIDVKKEAKKALVYLTKQDFNQDIENWNRWWEKNKKHILND